MFEPQFFDDLVKRLTHLLPEGIQSLEQDLQQQFRGILQSTFAKLDLVSREEFDVQVKVLARTREKLTLLENQVRLLEEKIPK